MKTRFTSLPVCLLLGLSITLPVIPAFADGQSATDKTVDVGQKAFDKGNFLKAEHSWQKAQSDLSRGTADEKLARVLQLLGDCYCKEAKFAKAQEAYKQAMDTLQSLSLDQTAAAARMKDLAAFFRPINLEGFDDNATAFAKQVGAICASASNKDEKRHIDISLKERFQEGIKELIESAPPNILGGKSGQSAVDAAAAMAPAGSPPVKQIRLDKQIAFDLVRDNDGKMKLANIEGIFINVGLWVKLKEFVMQNNEKNVPEAEVTAGAFGVDKKVHVDLPQNLFARIRQGIDKFDPFLAVVQPAVAATPSGSSSVDAATSAKGASSSATSSSMASASVSSSAPASSAPASGSSVSTSTSSASAPVSATSASSSATTGAALEPGAIVRSTSTSTTGTPPTSTSSVLSSPISPTSTPPISSTLTPTSPAATTPSTGAAPTEAPAGSAASSATTGSTP